MLYLQPISATTTVLIIYQRPGKILRKTPGGRPAEAGVEAEGHRRGGAPRARAYGLKVQDVT